MYANMHVYVYNYMYIYIYLICNICMFIHILYTCMFFEFIFYTILQLTTLTCGTLDPEVNSPCLFDQVYWLLVDADAVM